MAVEHILGKDPRRGAGAERSPKLGAQNDARRRKNGGVTGRFVGANIAFVRRHLDTLALLGGIVADERCMYLAAAGSLRVPA